MGRHLRKATDFWTGLASPSKRLIVTAAVILIAAMFLSMRFTGQVEYATLAKNVPTDQVAQIQKQLDAAGIKSQTADGASTVQVPVESLDKARIALASDPTGKSPGWEIFDQSGFGDTDFTQQVKFLRAKEGEVERTLTAMDQIDGADVNIAMPEKRVFSEEQKATTASVLLTMGSGQSLTPEQVGVVQNLVASAVPGLDTKNVSITDTRGNVLVAGTGSVDSQVSKRMQMEASYEQGMQSKLQALLDNVVGPGKAFVAYNATLDLDKKSIESETYQPKSRVPLEQHTTVERMRNTSGRNGGVVGVTSNTPSNTFPQANVTGSGRVQYDRRENEVKNGVNRTRTSSEATPGAPLVQSVAVSVSDQVPAATVAALQDQVAAAIGFNQARGDQVSVKRVAFAAVGDTAAASGAEAAPAAKGLFGQRSLTPVNLAKTVIAVLGVLFILFMARRALRRRQRGLEGILPELLEQGPIPVAALGDGLPEDKQLTGQVKTPIEKQMEDLALRKPEDMAKLIRGWLVQR